MPIPTYDDLFNPLLTALHQLGSSASIPEQEEKVAEVMNLTEEELEEPHGENNTKFSYNLAWARTYLKRYGLIDNSARGVWALTSQGQKTKTVDKTVVRKTVKAAVRKIRDNELSEGAEEPSEEGTSWEQELLDAVKRMPPEAFERLCQRVLRESGFIQVEVTGRSGDGGIDGRGVVKLGSILSFHVHFQCKRYKDTVSSPVVRDFRGAMVGRADKGIIITTGTFTRDAKAEALRDGAPPLDLIDGDDLVRMLKDYKLGVSVEEKIVEDITIDPDWFSDY
ncbi:MAG: restriction endonuclease [Verrucomicrobiales bacterium]|nr:restriction endonuclease [Verrucomicrobiales bacterium]